MVQAFPKNWLLNKILRLQTSRFQYGSKLLYINYSCMLYYVNYVGFVFVWYSFFFLDFYLWMFSLNAPCGPKIGLIKLQCILSYLIYICNVSGQPTLEFSMHHTHLTASSMQSCGVKWSLSNTIQYSIMKQMISFIFSLGNFNVEHNQCWLSIEACIQQQHDKNGLCRRSINDVFFFFLGHCLHFCNWKPSL